jgi:hypothetical protein
LVTRFEDVIGLTPLGRLTKSDEGVYARHSVGPEATLGSPDGARVLAIRTSRCRALTDRRREFASDGAVRIAYGDAIN